MPTYEYQCQNCHHAFELMQKITDDPVKECPQCHQMAVTRLISAAGFQLKGTGWYVTDFKNKDKPKAATKESEPKTPTTTDKPAAETTSKTDKKGDDK